MNADRLLALYDRVADAPDAVARLRRFVLDLAVRGKLVEQDPADEPASELLNRIAKEKERLAKARKIKNKPALPDITLQDALHDIPWTWQWCRFGNIVDFSAGRTPSRADKSFWNNGDYAWISIADMQDGKIIGATKETISNEARANVFKSEPEASGTMIMSFKLTIGKIARLGIPAFHNEAIISIRPHLNELDPFLFRFLPELARSGKTKGAIKGATLNRGSISNILIPLPPLAEQRRIVSKVDELMELLERLDASCAAREDARERLTVSSLSRLSSPDSDEKTFSAHVRFATDSLPELSARPEQIARLRRTVLDLAVRGKLVEQDPNDEPASELLNRIAKEKERLVKVGEIKYSKPLSSMSRNEMAFDAPLGWEWTRLGVVVACLDYRRKPINGDERNRRVEGKTPDELYPYFGATQQQGWIDDYLFDEELVLLGEDGIPFFDPLRSKAYIISGKTWVNNHAHVFKGIMVSHKFVTHYLNVFDYDDRIVGATRTKLNQARAIDIPFPLPPLAEQRRIVSKVDELMGLLDSLESGLLSAERIRSRLLESLLHEALSA